MKNLKLVLRCLNNSMNFETCSNFLFFCMSTKRKKHPTTKPLKLQTVEIHPNKNPKNTEKDKEKTGKSKRINKTIDSISSSSADEDAPKYAVTKSNSITSSDDVLQEPVLIKNSSYSSTSNSSSDSDENLIDSQKEQEEQSKNKEIWFPTIEYETIHRIYEYFNKDIPVTSILCTIHQCYGNIEEAVFRMANGQVSDDIRLLVDKPQQPNREKEYKYYS